MTSSSEPSNQAGLYSNEPTYVGSNVPWILRPDIQWIHQGSVWVAHDPLSRKSYRFGVDEKRLLETMDGKTSMVRLLQRLQVNHQPIQLSLSQCFQLLAMVAQRGMLIYRGVANASLAKRPPASWWQWISELPWKILFTKVSLWNPDRLLKRMAPKTDWLLSRQAVTFWCINASFIVLVIMSRWSEWTGQFPTWNELSAPRAWLGMGGVFIITRIVHELGHALSSTRLGVRVVDTGLMMMMGVACPYVDVSDSWKLSNRYERAWIAAGGMYFELVFAAFAGGIWCLTHSGWLHTICWQVTLVCTISTVLFNANPLMRYDGYYLLCDLCNVPNLRERGDRILKSWMIGEWKNDESPSVVHAMGIGLYGIGSSAYRILFLCGLCYAAVQLAESWDVRWIGIALSSLILLSSVLIPGIRLLQGAAQLGRDRRVSRTRWAGSWFALTLLVIACVSIPIPQRIHLRGTVQPKSWRPIYASTTGFIEAVEWKDGGSNQSSWNLQLRNSEIEHRFLASQQQFEQSLGDLDLAKRLAFHQPEWLDRIPILESAVNLTRTQFESQNRRRSELSIHPSEPQHSEEGSHPSSNFFWAEIPRGLISTSGTSAVLTMKEAPLGMPLSSETPIGWLMQSDDWVVRSPLSENQLELIQVGMYTKLRMHQRSWEVFEGTVEGIAFEAAVADEKTGSAKDSATALPSGPQFEVQIALKNTGRSLLPNGEVEMVVHSRGFSLGYLALQWVQRNVR